MTDLLSLTGAESIELQAVILGCEEIAALDVAAEVVLNDVTLDGRALLAAVPDASNAAIVPIFKETAAEQQLSIYWQHHLPTRMSHGRITTFVLLSRKHH